MKKKDADSCKRSVVVVLLQDMLEVFTCDMMVNEISELAEHNHISKESRRQPFAGTNTKSLFPPLVTSQWEEQVRRLYLLLMVKESTIEVLQRKTKEAAMATKRLKELLEARKSSSRDTSEVMVIEHEVRFEYEKHNQVRAALAKELAMLKQVNELSHFSDLTFRCLLIVDSKS
ncbi:hypothetical protein RJT34_20298 [Clitoria ternatea]|uniref:Callose synthase helical domain-containing protein n=1 Tax=Clitoria ternatea TaxID=43366 RepID=A0AAN9IST6_CLITE